MHGSSTALSPVRQCRQDFQAKLRDGVRRAIETVLEEELLTARVRIRTAPSIGR